MKPILFVAVVWTAAVQLSTAQVMLKAAHYIPAMEWSEIMLLMNGKGYGTAHVIDQEGIIYKAFGLKPSDPMDPVSWRPPVIPPLSTNSDPAPKSKKKGSKPIDPGCDTCSLIFLSPSMDKEVVIKLEQYFAKFQ